MPRSHLPDAQVLQCACMSGLLRRFPSVERPEEQGGHARTRVVGACLVLVNIVPEAAQADNTLRDPIRSG